MKIFTFLLGIPQPRPILILNLFCFWSHSPGPHIFLCSRQGTYLFSIIFLHKFKKKTVLFFDHVWKDSLAEDTVNSRKNLEMLVHPSMWLQMNFLNLNKNCNSNLYIIWKEKNYIDYIMSDMSHNVQIQTKIWIVIQIWKQKFGSFRIWMYKNVFIFKGTRGGKAVLVFKILYFFISVL